MTARFLNSTAARDIKPGNKIECFGKWYWVRCISYHGASLTFNLTAEDEPLSENIRIVVTVPGDLMIDVEAR